MEIDGIKIEPQSGSAGTDIPISISVTAVNEGLDKTIVFDGVCGDATAQLSITHEGMREEFVCLEDSFILADGGTYNVLKNEL